MKKNNPPIDYQEYAKQMRGALSGPEICNEDLTINHSYFNTKKGYYWSEADTGKLIKGLQKHGPNWPAIIEQFFTCKEKNKEKPTKPLKSEIELDIRSCILLNVKDSKEITEKAIKALAKSKTSRK